MRVYSSKRLPLHVEAFLSDHADYDAWSGAEPITLPELIEQAHEVDGMITSGLPIGETVLSAFPRLRCVSTASVGYDHFDTNLLRQHGVIGTHTPGVLDETVADLTFALMLATARRIVELDGMIRSGHWGKQPEDVFFGCDVHHRTLGIIGMGRIGEAVARRAKLGFEMNVSYHNRSRNRTVEQSLGAAYLSLADLLSTSDFVVLLTPLTAETQGMMDREAFARMKPSSIFINMSRGATVDESALYEALVNRTIRAAGLDVFREEPTPGDNPLMSLANVVATPHIGSATGATRDEMAMLAATNLIAVLEGRFGDAKIVPELQDLSKES